MRFLNGSFLARESFFGSTILGHIGQVRRIEPSAFQESGFCFIFPKEYCGLYFVELFIHKQMYGGGNASCIQYDTVIIYYSNRMNVIFIISYKREFYVATLFSFFCVRVSAVICGFA